jgi:hypothetical protein
VGHARSQVSIRVGRWGTPWLPHVNLGIRHWTDGQHVRKTLDYTRWEGLPG